MCGITGITHPLHSTLIEAMTETISHRGPDDFGVYSFDSLSLGHRRLAIQDLTSNGHQPMFTEDERYCIVFNGEIYNHFDIRKDLSEKYNFKSTSDTETLLYGFVEYGTDLFNMLNGIFSFALFDNHTKDLYIVRDHFGVKPLYYYSLENSFAFASELKAINSLPFINREIDFNGIIQYIRFLWSPGERTPLINIKKLLPCHYIKVNIDSPSDLDIVKYYTIPFDGTYEDHSESEWVELLDQQLLKAVERQLLSDVPVGFFLSGGLDSSTIVAMAKRLMPDKKIQCYTIDSGIRDANNEGFSDDLFYAKKVAKHLDVDLTIIDGEIEIMKEFDMMVYHLDEPQADVAPIHVYNICKQARKDGNLVLLGGTAGDDVFSGYRRHQAVRLESIYKFIPNLVVIPTQWVFKLFRSNSSLIRRIKKLLVDLHKSSDFRLVGYFSWISDESSRLLINENLRKKLNIQDPIQILIDTFKHIPKEKNNLNRMLYLELKYFLPDHNLNYTDKLSMAHGIEVRVPFLDRELVEFSTKIPPSLKMKGTTTKYLLKKVMEKYLPHEVIYRSKAGFGAPIRKWIQTDLKDFLKLEFSKENIDKQGLLSVKDVQTLLKNNTENKFDGSYSILSLMSINSWMRQFVDNKPKLN